MNILELDNISKSYAKEGRSLQVLKDFCLKVSEGEFAFARGPSGCGKTTLLMVAGGMLEPEAGRVLMNGTDVYASGRERRSAIRAGQLGFVFQQFHLLPYLSVLDNILSPVLALPGPPQARTGTGKRAQELVRQFGLQHRRGHFPAELSTGERQRCALARALMNEPSLILADEPTGNLDEENAETVFRYLSEFTKSGGAVLLVSHSGKTGQYADTIIDLG